jgi:hypothetical protein
MSNVFSSKQSGTSPNVFCFQHPMQQERLPALPEYALQITQELSLSSGKLGVFAWLSA